VKYSRIYFSGFKLYSQWGL